MTEVLKTETTYAILLGRLANSFYDPVSGCNLFKSTPRYNFNHPPTPNIKLGVESGRLVDLKGNVLNPEVEKEVVEDMATKVSAQAKVNANANQTQEELKAKEEAAVAKAKSKDESDDAKAKADEKEAKVEEKEKGNKKTSDKKETEKSGK